ncbi:uncharacterized protein CBL_12172 [Carabus blaptoides fortunei]
MRLINPQQRPPDPYAIVYSIRFTRPGKVMNEADCGGGDGGGGKGDCNSNHSALAAATSADRSTASCLSNASSQDNDFVQDNSDYQWFLDYGYRDGCIHHHTSVLSSLTESYGGPDEIGYYDALSKNLDANLAEADMESFRTEDIHALLTTLPAMCTDMQLVTDANREGEMFASVTGSLMAKFDFESSVSPHSSSQGEESAASPDTMSICKSELLFSPVKDTPMPGANFSVDSLDCDLEHDILLTCQANKDNYTIAFEGSVTMYSEESDYTEPSHNSDTHRCCGMNKHHHQKLLDTSMARSDSGLTTWSKLKKRCSENQLRRHPSGNNNNNTSADEMTSFANLGDDNALKSQSLPNLYKNRLRWQHGNCCGGATIMSNSSIDSPSPVQRRPHCVKVFDIQHQTSKSTASCYSDMAISVEAAPTSTDRVNKPQAAAHNFSLVKLFMKQKSISAEGMSCAMDQSSTSECWPASQSEDSGDSFEMKARALRMTRSGYSDKARSAPECSILLDSLVDAGMAESAQVYRTHDLIREEGEDIGSERSESVEQLTESASIFNSYEQERISPHCCRKLPSKFNVNNNNSSMEQDEEILAAAKRRIRRGTQTKRYSVSSNESDASSSTESAGCTRLHAKPTSIVVSTKHSATQFPAHLMNKSMQTSCRLARSDLVRIVEPSFLAKLKQQGDSQRPVYVVYPNYTLPDLDFLKEKREDVTKVYLMPQKYTKEESEAQKKASTGGGARGRRPFSCNDMEMLKKKGFSHVRDWDSLTFLLPVECRQVLADVPEFMNILKDREEDLLKPKEKPLFCVSPPMRQKQRPLSCDCGSLMDRNNVSSSSSTATQPSSGYRGSSTMLMTDSSQNSPAPQSTFNPLFVYRYDSVTSSEASLMMSEKQRSITTTASIGTPPVPKRSEQKYSVPPRPPLPKGILRKSLENVKAKKNIANTKRYSMFEMGAEEEYTTIDLDNGTKRKSLHEPYYLSQRRTLSEHSTETEDEGVEAGHGSESSMDERFETMTVRPPTPPIPRSGDSVFHLGTMSCDELEQLEEYLKMSGISYADTDDWNETELLKLRSHVSKFLTLKINRDHYDSGTSLSGKKSVSFAERATNVLATEDAQKLYNTPPNSPNVSAMLHRHYQGKTLVDMPICEEGELSPDGYRSPQLENVPLSEKSSPIDLSQKMSLISAVTHSVEQLIHHFSAANDQGELNALGDSELNPACAKLVLSSLCPSLYALLNDGLKPTLDTPFGAINNSVWQVVEASAQQGPLTKALNELVMRINTEDVFSEGLLKFNAFVFGLLNVRSLDAWASYLRTRETILRKYYTADSLLLLAQTSGPSMRSLVDTLIATLQPLALLPFQMDLLFESRQLHMSLKRMDTYQQPSSPTHLRSNMSQSCDDTEDLSVATMIHRCPSDESSDPSLPDLLNSSAHGKVQLREERQRPRSCVDPNIGLTGGFKLCDDVTGTVKKRWSGIHMGSKFGQAFDRLADDTEEEYTDSLEHTAHNVQRRGARNGELTTNSQEEGSSSPAPSLHEDGPESLESQLSDDRPLNGGKFRRLQMKWEMLSGKDVMTQPSPPLSPSHTLKSKIPRLVNSPVKSGIPVLSPSFLKMPTKQQQPVKKATTPPSLKKPTPVSKIATTVKSSVTKKSGVVTRTSRVDQLESPENRIHAIRPSSLPYRPVSSTQGAKGSKLTPPRRAVSSSVTRKSQQQTQVRTTPKVVRTLTHRLPSDNGHLSFNEGERLKVILDVDSKWLLCCRGDQKGLVPRSAVIDAGKLSYLSVKVVGQLAGAVKSR